MSRLSSLVILLVVLMLPLAACGPSTPEGKIAQARASYKVEINSWQVKKEPAPEAVEGEAEATGAEASGAEGSQPGDEGTAGEGAAGEGAAGEGAAEEVAAGPPTKDILFDLVIYFRGRESLKGITIDLTHASAAEEEKATYHHYVDTSGIISGDTGQYDFVMEDMPLKEGDIFSVSVLEGVPPDLSRYREFSEQAP